MTQYHQPPGIQSSIFWSTVKFWFELVYQNRFRFCWIRTNPDVIVHEYFASHIPMIFVEDTYCFVNNIRYFSVPSASVLMALLCLMTYGIITCCLEHQISSQFFSIDTFKSINFLIKNHQCLHVFGTRNRANK